MDMTFASLILSLLGFLSFFGLLSLAFVAVVYRQKDIAKKALESFSDSEPEDRC